MRPAACACQQRMHELGAGRRAWDTRIRWKARRRFIELNSDATGRLAAQAGVIAARPSWPRP